MKCVKNRYADSQLAAQQIQASRTASGTVEDRAVTHESACSALRRANQRLWHLHT